MFSACKACLVFVLAKSTPDSTDGLLLRAVSLLFNRTEVYGLHGGSPGEDTGCTNSLNVAGVGTTALACRPTPRQERPTGTGPSTHTPASTLGAFIVSTPMCDERLERLCKTGGKRVLPSLAPPPAYNCRAPKARALAARMRREAVTTSAPALAIQSAARRYLATRRCKRLVRDKQIEWEWSTMAAEMSRFCAERARLRCRKRQRVPCVRGRGRGAGALVFVDRVGYCSCRPLTNVCATYLSRLMRRVWYGLEAYFCRL